MAFRLTALRLQQRRSMLKKTFFFICTMFAPSCNWGFQFFIHLEKFYNCVPNKVCQNYIKIEIERVNGCQPQVQAVAKLVRGFTLWTLTRSNFLNRNKKNKLAHIKARIVRINRLYCIETTIELLSGALQAWCYRLAGFNQYGRYCTLNHHIGRYSLQCSTVSSFISFRLSGRDRSY